MSFHRTLIASLGLVLLLSDCSLQAESSPQPLKPGLIIKPNPACTAELQQAIALLLDVEQVTIASDAFTQSNRLTLERKQHRDANGQLVMGRTLTIPTNVQLLMQGKQYLLQDEQGNQTQLLSSELCKLSAKTR
ncbi:hypothetical protein [Shewanella sp. Isolate11]|uniref:hypothetical protein n=1 Tax=Shewanella sp. Isolate11 TaxID=2908530 RepID=UPI001EFD4A86|nr:hypothetical protein [Shewanella sp. Isolate11]MCG9696089.1 hypothetical protein [Shewanella sp. Isolate11]